MPIPPKAPGQRVRRNKDQAQWRSLQEPGAVKAPPLPAKSPVWLKETREWWKTIWASPMAAVWLPSDVAVLVRLARIIEADNRGEAAASMLAEARQLEDRFGLSPRARRLLQWEVAKASAAVAEPEAKTTAAEPTPAAERLADVRRLKAV